jgi:hypothetical protein
MSFNPARIYRWLTTTKESTMKKKLDPRDGAPKIFTQAFRGSGIHEECHDGSASTPTGTRKDGFEPSSAALPSHPDASFHDHVAGIGKVQVAGMSRTKFAHPIDDSKMVTAPTVEKRLAAVLTTPGTRQRNNPNGVDKAARLPSRTS